MTDQATTPDALNEGLRPTETDPEPTAGAVTARCADPEAGLKAAVEAPSTTDQAAGQPALSDAGGRPTPFGCAQGQETPAATTQVAASPADATEFRPFELTGDDQQPQTTAIEMLDDVELDVKIELGRTSMYIEDVLRLGVGAVVELDKPAGDPVDIFVNERLVARGEVLVLNDSFCVRINQIHSPVPEREDG